MAASAQQEVQATAPNADVVGQAFARQYYTILHQSPALVYRFYQDISKFGRAEEGGNMSSTTTMDAINERIQSYGSLKADLKYVDAQDSYNGGVIVLVTGDMIGIDDSRRGFTQTFFLAPQDKGYFVLNDIFRYVEDDHHQNENQEMANGVATPVTPNAVETLAMQENHISEQCEDASGGEVYNPPENGGDQAKEEEEPVAEVVNEAPNESHIVVESRVKVEELPKKTYASIVKVMRENAVAAAAAAAADAPPRSVPKMQEQQPTAVPTLTSVVEAPAPGANAVEEGNHQDAEGDSNSIYVKNLPLNANHALLEEAFKKFGLTKNGGIQVRSNRGFCFGFVEFEEASAARSAIEASPITLGGREVIVEEKKSTNSRGSNRGRFPSGRGNGLRSEGARGRANYGGGGRGYGRGDANYGNRATGRGNGYQRPDRGGGPRAHRVSAPA